MVFLGSGLRREWVERTVCSSQTTTPSWPAVVVLGLVLGLLG